MPTEDTETRGLARLAGRRSHRACQSPTTFHQRPGTSCPRPVATEKPAGPAWGSAAAACWPSAHAYQEAFTACPPAPRPGLRSQRPGFWQVLHSVQGRAGLPHLPSGQRSSCPSQPARQGRAEPVATSASQPCAQRRRLNTSVPATRAAPCPPRHRCHPRLPGGSQDSSRRDSPAACG